MLFTGANQDNKSSYMLFEHLLGVVISFINVELLALKHAIYHFQVSLNQHKYDWINDTLWEHLTRHRIIRMGKWTVN